MSEKRIFNCSFCENTDADVALMIVNKDAAICCECVDLCCEIVTGNRSEKELAMDAREAALS